MSRQLIAHIDPWSVARTVFPLAWLLAFIAVLIIYTLAGSVIMNMASEIYDVPAGSGRIGMVVALFASLITGFIYSIFATVLAAIGAAAYNFLAGLGGGIEISMESINDGQISEKLTVPDGLSQSVEIIPQALPLDGTARETEQQPRENDVRGGGVT